MAGPAPGLYEEALAQFERVAGMQCALHAICHTAIKLPVDALERPVHSDPAVLAEWPDASLGGASTSSGTAPWPTSGPCSATTRRSGREPDQMERTTPRFALSLAAATWVAASGSFSDYRTDSLEPDKMANLAVIDMKWDAESFWKPR
ncbi:hypothetical protein CDD83_5316 [Cordyceps sp. RAO-2017]|nr:hypothetical protein CDD83_5316 [Cordyceps sp. RAO-2017]